MKRERINHRTISTDDVQRWQNALRTELNLS
jgi:hypothetical protein